MQLPLSLTILDSGNAAAMATITLIHRPTISCTINFSITAIRVPLRHRKWKPRQIAVASSSVTQPNTFLLVSLSNSRPNQEHRRLLPETSEEDFLVVNFYHFVSIEDPEAEVAKHLYFMRVISLSKLLNSQLQFTNLEIGILVTWWTKFIMCSLFFRLGFGYTWPNLPEWTRN